MAQGGQHAADARRELGDVDVQFDVRGELPGAAVRAQVIGARYVYLTHCRQHWLGAQFPIASLMAASTGDAPLRGRWRGKPQEFVQRCSSRVMHGRTHRHLDGFQIETARLAAILEDDAQ